METKPPGRGDEAPPGGQTQHQQQAHICTDGRGQTPESVHMEADPGGRVADPPDRSVAHETSGRTGGTCHAAAFAVNPSTPAREIVCRSRITNPTGGCFAQSDVADLAVQFATLQPPGRGAGTRVSSAALPKHSDQLCLSKCSIP
jgi:hypothetical protein